MTAPSKEVIGNAELWLGDCFEILPTLQRPDAIVCDPPYGQGLNTNVTGRSVTGRSAGSGRPYAIHDKRRKTASGLHSVGVATQFPDAIQGDTPDAPFDVQALLPYSDRVLLWGAHKLAHRLPKGRWLAWDKVPTGRAWAPEALDSPHLMPAISSSASNSSRSTSTLPAIA